jgi:hypothetical protein
MNKTDELKTIIVKELIDNGHIGRQNTILCQYLIDNIYRDYRITCTEAEIRRAISSARKDGCLIGSASTAKPHGYYMIQTMDEFNNFIQQEIGARLADLSQTVRAMEKSAEKKLVIPIQPELVLGIREYGNKLAPLGLLNVLTK